MKKPLTYDGCGINDSDEFGSRIATFSNIGSAQAKTYGPMFAAAPELLKVAKESTARIEQLCTMLNNATIKLGLGKKVNADDWTDDAREAVAKAEGRA